MTSADVVTTGGVVSDVEVEAGGRRWRRVLLRTPWLGEDDDLGAVVADALAGVRCGGPRPGDVVAIAEKVAVVTSGRAVDADVVRPGPLAHLLARAVRPVGDSRGLSLPRKMQYVVAEVGRPRVVLAALAAALTRPFGRRGVFYRVAGDVARDLDGLRGAYPQTLLPPLRPAEAALLGHHLASRLGRVVAIVDVNDRGGSVRSVSAGGPDPGVVLAALVDNPHGDEAASTPVVLLRPLDALAAVAPSAG
ncbi:MAG TPA: coenzyme F420-0:L-glutamate ligase [Pseudonocardia sp.]|nr:coenzyme F420-0:L-glutamate ligase [Pseudonocardia sp.]